jgi:hypothetical protein
VAVEPERHLLSAASIALITRDHVGAVAVVLDHPLDARTWPSMRLSRATSVWRQ